MAFGCTAERALMKGRWRLRRDSDGTLVKNPGTGTTAFTPEQLIAFTKARFGVSDEFERQHNDSPDDEKERQ